MLPLRKAAFLLLAFFGCLALHSDAPHLPLSPLARLPRITLWAWERREDLRALDPGTFAVAYLDQTLTLGATSQDTTSQNTNSQSQAFSAQPRRDPVAFPAAMARIPVVRIEAPRYAILDDRQRQQAIAAILTTAREPNIAALQLDFDATRSQRPFYSSLLTSLRSQLAPGLPLSITALASWCADDDWLHTLPIDEAVPMFFRMEPYTTPGHRPTLAQRQAHADTYPIREPLCQSSIGLSTTEPWPKDLAGKRIYLFPDQGWQHEIPDELPRRLE